MDLFTLIKDDPKAPTRAPELGAKGPFAHQACIF